MHSALAGRSMTGAPGAAHVPTTSNGKRDGWSATIGRDRRAGSTHASATLPRPRATGRRYSCGPFRSAQGNFGRVKYTTILAPPAVVVVPLPLNCVPLLQYTLLV